jgi:hypothetical protein
VNVKINSGKPNDQTKLAHDAASGDTECRRAVSNIAHPLITQQSLVFCKRYCVNNRFNYICTLDREWGRNTKDDRPLCDWGNGCYTWMLDDLTKAERLLNYTARDGAALVNYLTTIINSVPFYERWKNWRFGDYIYVPSYIKELGGNADKIFRLLCAGDQIANIAQRVGLSEKATETTAHSIHIELTKRKRLHLLNRPKLLSLTNYSEEDDDDNDMQRDIPCDRQNPEQAEINKRLGNNWQRLTPVEQFVLEAMVIDELDANSVLEALCQHGISIKEGTPPEQINPQQLYFFRRKTLLKLAHYGI